MKDYEKAYKEALERARRINNGDGIPVPPDYTTCEAIFPELKESEDERMRKEIIQFLELPHPQFVGKRDHKEWIAWLEKQKEENFIDKNLVKEEAHRIAWEYSKHYDPLLSKESWCEMAALDMAYWLEKQGEQDQKHFELKAGHWYICHRAYCCRADHLTVKEGERFMCEKDGVVKGFVIKDPEKYFKEVCAPAPIEDEQNPTDKAEPKFKIGNYIVYSRNDSLREILYVYDIRDDRYYFNDNVHLSWSIKECDEKCHLWTIQDAKDGDVLFTTCDNINEIVFIYHGIELNVANCYFLYSKTNNECKTFNSICSVKADIHPATKEQRDLLFSKMKEAGYVWDAEKKELKKIEKESTWSEEDEKQIRQIERIVKDSGASTNLQNKISDWLKSLKPNHWKPSKEQMEALNAINTVGELSYVGQEDLLVKLYNDLKNL